MTRLPNRETAAIDLRKINGYLLNLRHPRGAAKAKFFLRFGFAADRPGMLIEALLEHACMNGAIELKTTKYGTSYSVEGPLKSPDGRNPQIRAIWIIRTGEAFPSFVTAIPMKGKGRL